jgi:protein AroM
MSNTIGVVTIGQTPREDIIPDLKQAMGDVGVLEFGALDQLSAEELAALSPRHSEEVLVTRLRNGTHVEIDGDLLAPLVQAAVDRSESGPNTVATLLMCTGPFPNLMHRKLLFKAEDLLSGAVRALAGESRVGVICPLESQRESSRRKFNTFVTKLDVVSANPYGELAELDEPARSLADAGADIIVLDCMGFNQSHRATVEEQTGLPVLVANVAVGKLVGSLIA